MNFPPRLPRTAAALLTLLPTLAAAQQPPLGVEPVSAKTALAYFRAACLDTSPGYAGADAVLAGLGLAESPGTGTWFHPTLELSVQADDACTMVFASDDDPGQLGMILAMEVAAAAGAEATVGLDPATGGASATGPDGAAFQVRPLPEAPRPTFLAGLWPPG